MHRGCDGRLTRQSLASVREPPLLQSLEDTVEFFNLVLGLKLTDEEKSDLVAYMRQL